MHRFTTCQPALAKREQLGNLGRNHALQILSMNAKFVNM
jgi:hypothetical protein